MAVLTTEALIIKWQARFADNVTREIDEGDFRELMQDLADSFSSVLGGPTVITWKSNCAVATTGNITLSGEQTIDGVLTSASRVLVRAQSTASENGIYVSAAGAWSRATDADTDAEIEGAAVGITAGDTLIQSSWIQTTADVTLGSSNIVWQQLGFGVSYQNLVQTLTQGNSAGDLTIEDLADPVNDQDAATKFYVDNLGVGLIDLEDLPKNTIEEVTATSYVFVNEDHLKIKKFTNASGCTVTIPIGLDQGWSTTVYRAPGAGTLTLNSIGEYQGTDNTIGTEKGWASIVHLGSNVHAASGALGTLGLTIGTIDSQTKSSNGLVISGSSVYAQTADATYPGLISHTSQTIGGIKVFNDALGIGTTPPALHSTYRYQFIGATQMTMAAVAANEVYYSSNVYYDTTWRRRIADEASMIALTTDGGIDFYTAASGAVGSAITWGNPKLQISNAGVIIIPTAPSTSNSGNAIVARNSTTGALELRSDIVVTSGAQTIGGAKTFSSTPIISATPSTSNSGNSIIARNTSTGALELRSDVVVTSGSQTIGGVKTFSSTPVISATPSTSNTGNSLLARNTSTGALELRGDTDGTYTPTLTNSTNISSSSVLGPFQYQRSGNTVTVSGNISISATASSAVTILRLTLPVASTFAFTYQCAGTAVQEVTGGTTQAIAACVKGDDIGLNKAQITYMANSTSAQAFWVHFTYRVI